MPALLADIRSLLRSRREERAGDVFTMDRRLARNESVDPDELLAAMTVAGMDDAALADLVDMVARRSEYRSRSGKLSAAQKELANVKGAIRDIAQAAFEAAEAVARDF